MNVSVKQLGIEILYPGNNGAITLRRDNYYFEDETVGAAPAPKKGEWYRTGIFADAVADFDPLTPPPVVITQHVAVEDPANPGTYVWSEQGEGSKGGDTKYIFHANERLETLYFTLHDRRDAFKDTRRKRFALTVDELDAGNADWTADHANVSGDYTHRLTSAVSLAGATYNYRIHWKQVAGEYEFDVFENHAGRWNRFGAISDIVYKYAATDPEPTFWTDNTAYSTDDIVIGKAPAGVTETENAWYVMTAVQDRPITIATLDATEWNAANWTFEPFTPTKQDIVKTFHAALPDPATLLSGSRVAVVNNIPDSSKNGSYTVIGPVGGAGTGYAFGGSETTFGSNSADFTQGDITLEYFNDDVATDSSVGKSYPDFDPLAKITLPSLVGQHGKRLLVATDWAARLAKVPTAEWVTDADTNATFKLPPTGFPDDGRDMLSFYADETNNQWIIVSGGNVTLDYVAKTYTNLADTVGKIVPGSIFIGEGTGDLPAGVHYVDSNGTPVKD